MCLYHFLTEFLKIIERNRIDAGEFITSTRGYIKLL